jgi:lysophospholipase L1-like esterase
MSKKIILIGDSITDSFPVSVLLKDYDVINNGISGDTTEGVFNRLNKDVHGHKPDMVFLMIGTNDFALGRTDAEIIEKTEDIIEGLKNKSGAGSIYVFSILPVRGDQNRPNGRIIEVNQAVKRITEKHKVNYIDLHSAFKDDKGELKGEYTDDGLHLTFQAYEHWTEIIKNAIDSFDGK